MTGSADC